MPHRIDELPYLWVSDLRQSGGYPLSAAPRWYYRPAFQWLKYLSGRWSFIGGILLPALLAVVFAAAPFLDRRLERRPWKRPISVGAFFLFLVCYIGLGIASYHDDYSDKSMAAQMHLQNEASRTYMAPFVPEAAAGTIPASLVSADPLVVKGHALFESQPCNSCHGEGGIGTAAGGLETL
ncbi:MAG: hypothetical protein ABI197_05325 [Granulicella sp.]